MHPEKLRVEGFGSFTNGEYTFSPGLFLIEGINEDKEGSSNGSGKSIFFVDALVWVLFENTCRGIRFDDVIKKDTSYAEVEVCLRHQDSLLKVKRRKDRGKGSQLFLNDSRASQEEIERVLGLDYNTFTASIVHAQLFRGFADRTEVEQKTILTTLLGLEEWDEYKKRATEATTEVEKKLIEQEAHRDAYQIRLQVIGNTEEIEQQITEFEEQRRRKIEVVDKELNEIIKFCNILIEDINPYLKEIEKWENVRVNLGKEKNSISEAKSKLQVQINKQNEVKNIAKHDKNKLSAETLRITNLQGVCPTCRQEINEKHKIKCSKVNLDADKQLDKQIKICDVELIKLEKDFTEQEINIERMMDKLDESNSKLDNLYTKVREIEANEKLVEMSRINLAAKKALRLQIELERNPYSEVIKINEAEANVLNRAIADCTEKIMELQEWERYVKFWEEGFSNRGIKSYIFDSIVPEFTEKANNYIQLLTNQPIQILFDTQREKKTGGLADKFTIKLVDKAGERPYAAWSGGEKKRIAVAIDLALSDLVLLRSRIGWDFVLFDECFDGLDEEGKEMMVYLLEDIMKVRERVYVISHDATMNGLIENKILVTKVRGESSIAS